LFDVRSDISRTQNNELYKLYNFVKNRPNVVHNLTSETKLPFSLIALLSLGLKFSFSFPPSYNMIRNGLDDGVRKLSWLTFFKMKGESRNQTDLEKIIRQCNPVRKSYRADLERSLFPNPDMYKNFISEIQKNTVTQTFLSIGLLKTFKKFINDNKLIVKPADKNAGVCVMCKSDYDNEILNQLSNTEHYHPSTDFLFESGANNFKYMVHRSQDFLPTALKLKTIIPRTYAPATFYVLPKIHKSYTVFPAGRPISSTIHTINKNVSKILNMLLQPVMNFVPDMILDSTHFLILLRQVKLNPARKYTLVTIDIKSLYPSLVIRTCKKHCSDMFNRKKCLINLPVDLNAAQLERIMHLSLDYSYVKYENDYFLQHKGIQMGNNASVPVANITVFEELEPMFKRMPNIIFRKRLLDDIFSIVDSTEILDFEPWLTAHLQHDSLEFTFNHSETKIDFLDITISLSENNEIHTSLFTKPMSKHQFIHFNSNHPKHLIKSIPYSQGLRLKRICSDQKDFEWNLEILMTKFRNSQYPEDVLMESKVKLNSITRDMALKPKTRLLLNNLRIHNPELLSIYNIPMIDLCQNKCIPNNKVFIVVPYYKNVFNYSTIIKNTLQREMEMCQDAELKHIAHGFKPIVSFKKTNSLSTLLA
jgi:hypothetical protein